MAVEVNKYAIKENSRKNLLKYTKQAWMMLPYIPNPNILEIGCGIGVQLRYFINKTQGNLWAIDSDPAALAYLQEKLLQENFLAKLNIIQGTFPDVFQLSPPQLKFDIIWAEGLLNIIGFEFGLKHMVQYLKNPGYIVIHDELARKEEKIAYFESLNLYLIGYFTINSEIWIRDYYKPMEEFLNRISSNTEIKHYFDSEWQEIFQARNNPDLVQSIFYILKL